MILFLWYHDVLEPQKEFKMIVCTGNVTYTVLLQFSINNKSNFITWLRL